MRLSTADIERLNERLNAEWDVERWLRLFLGAGSFAVALAGAPRSRCGRRLILFIGVLGIWAAVADNSPLQRLLERVGVRTRQEVERERYYQLHGEEPEGLQ